MLTRPLLLQLFRRMLWALKLHLTLNCVEVSGKYQNFHFWVNVILEIQKWFGTKKKKKYSYNQPTLSLQHMHTNEYMNNLLVLVLLILECIQNLSTICMDDFCFHQIHYLIVNNSFFDGQSIQNKKKNNQNTVTDNYKNAECQIR